MAFLKSFAGKRSLDTTVIEILSRSVCGNYIITRFNILWVCEEQNQSFVYNEKMKIKLIIW